MAGAAIEKGVAFPVCVSVNDVICNNSPLASQEMVSSVNSAEKVSNLSLRISTLTFLLHTPSIAIIGTTRCWGYCQTGSWMSY